MVRKILALTVMLIAGSAAAAPLTLTDVLTHVYQTSPVLQAERASFAATSEEVATAAAGWFPTIIGTASVGVRDNDTEIANTTTSASTNPRYYALDLTQPLYRGGRTVANTAAAEARVTAAGASLLATEQTVLLDTVNTYMLLVTAEAVLAANTKNEAVLQRQRDDTQARFELGDRSRTDVALAEARLANATASRIAAEGDVAQQRAAFMRVVGLEATALTAPASLPTIPAALDDIVSGALNNSPAVLSANALAEALNYDARSAAGVLLPELNLTANVSRSEESTSAIDSLDNAEALLTLSVPLYQSGSEYSTLRAAKARANEAQIKRESAARTAREAAVQAYETFRTADARVTALAAEVTAAQLALEGTKLEYDAGLKDLIDVLDGERDLLNAEVNSARAKRDQVVAAYSVLAAVGQLTASQLSLLPTTTPASTN